jgi:hypothetical protein
MVGDPLPRCGRDPTRSFETTCLSWSQETQCLLLTFMFGSSWHIVDMYKPPTRVLRGDHGRPILAVSVRSGSFIYRCHC